jgi:hypothetical protein
LRDSARAASLRQNDKHSTVMTGARLL